MDPRASVLSTFGLMSDPLLSLEKLFFKHQSKDSWALKDVSLELLPGMILGILGPNGAGKTTLLRILLGILKPERGRLRILGNDISCVSDDKKRSLFGCIGGHLESPGLYRTVTAREYLKYFAKLRNRPQTDHELDLLCQSFRLEPDGVTCGKLSQGNKQKLHLARSLLGSPEILLWDEPTDNLDPSVQRETLHRLVRYVSESNRAAIIASHRIEHLESICTHILVLENGHTKWMGSLDDLHGMHRAAEIHWETRRWPLKVLDEMGIVDQVFHLSGEELSSAETHGAILSSAISSQLPDLIQGLSLAGYRITYASHHQKNLEEFYHEIIQEPPVPDYPVMDLVKPKGIPKKGLTPIPVFPFLRNWAGWEVCRHEIRSVVREPRFLFPFLLLSLFLIVSQIVVMGYSNVSPWGADWAAIRQIMGLLGIIAASLCIPLGADSFAGERERNSLEVLWIAVQKPGAIFFGKALALLPFTLLLGWLGQGILVSWLAFMGFDLMPFVSEILLLFLLTPIWAVLLSSISIFISSRAISVRSASQHMMPILLVFFVLIPWAGPILLANPMLLLIAVLISLVLSWTFLRLALTKWLNSFQIG